MALYPKKYGVPRRLCFAMELATSLRERKKAQTRADLVRAALDLFREHGYQSTTVDDIVERASYSRTTFFRCFGNKEDVLFDGVPESLAQVAEHLDPVAEDPVAELQRVLTADALRYATLASDRLRAVELWFTEPVLERRFLDISASMQRVSAAYLADRWHVSPDESIEPEIVATAIVGVTVAAVRHAASHSDPAGIEDALERGFALIRAGVDTMRTTI